MRTALRLVLLAWASCGLSATAAAGAHLLQRGVVVEPDSGKLLLAAPEGGIEARDARSGDLLWHSRAGELPIGSRDDEVLALAGPPKRGLLAYARLDLADGTQRDRRFAPLPHPARALIDDRLGESFAVSAVDPSGTLAWHYEATQVSGARPAAPPRLLEAKGAPAPEPQDIRLQGGFQWEGDALKVVDLPKTTAAASLEIGQPTPGQPRRFRSGSGAYRLISTRHGHDDYHWRFEDQDDRALGEMRSRYSYLPFEITRGVVVFVSPLRARREAGEVSVEMPQLVAVDLASGKQLWSREIRDTVYRGPFPP